MSNPHLHLQADQLYPFDARGIAKRFRHAAIFGALELVLGFMGGGGVAHFAHLGGMLGGLLMIRFWRGQPPFGSNRRR